MAFLIDLDGTIYCGAQPLPQSAGFVRWLHRRQIPYRFVTNAPENHPEDIEGRLRAMGIPVQQGSVITCAMMAADCLGQLRDQRGIGRVRVLGDGYLQQLVARQGLAVVEEDPDCVLVSMAREITLGQIQQACCQIREGALFVATNPDGQIPSERGLVPHTGMVVDAIRDCTGVEPIMAGKPSGATREYFPRLFGCNAGDIAVIGDRLDTDMAYARACGYRGYLVLTGYADREMARENRELWDELFDTLDDIIVHEEQRIAE